MCADDVNPLCGNKYTINREPTNYEVNKEVGQEINAKQVKSMFNVLLPEFRANS